MKDEATPEQIAMARRICASVCGGDAVGRAAAREFLRGDADDESDMRIALAAIIETQRLCAEVADTRRRECLRAAEETISPGDRRVFELQAATAVGIFDIITLGKHYGKDEG